VEGYIRKESVRISKRVPWLPSFHGILDKGECLHIRVKIIGVHLNHNDAIKKVC